MRVFIGLLLGALLGACGSGEGAGATVQLILPAPGLYLGTLTGYVLNTCPGPLNEPVGILDASLHITYLVQDRIEVEGSRDWYYGPVMLSPGDPNDSVERLAWRGTAQDEAVRDGCDLRASALLRYFPTDQDNGSLHVLQHIEVGSGSCSYMLPCDSHAIWSMMHPAGT